MNRKEFLRKLQMELYKLPRYEIDDAIAYYNEYFEEAGPDQEQDVIRELGSPAKIATQIKADYAVRQLENLETGHYGGQNRSNQAGAEGQNRGNTDSGTDQYADSSNQQQKNQKPPGKLSAAWWVVIGIVGGIFAAPVAIPVAFALAALVIAVFIGIVAILIAALVTTIALIIMSICAVIFGIAMLATSGPMALLIIGLGLMGISLMALLTAGIIALANLFFRMLARKRRESQVRREEKKRGKLQQKIQPQPNAQQTTQPEQPEKAGEDNE